MTARRVSAGEKTRLVSLRCATARLIGQSAKSTAVCHLLNGQHFSLASRGLSRLCARSADLDGLRRFQTALISGYRDASCLAVGGSHRSWQRRMDFILVDAPLAAPGNARAAKVCHSELDSESLGRPFKIPATRRRVPRGRDDTLDPQSGTPAQDDTHARFADRAQQAEPLPAKIRRNSLSRNTGAHSWARDPGRMRQRTRTALCISGNPPTFPKLRGTSIIRSTTPGRHLHQELPCI